MKSGPSNETPQAPAAAGDPMRRPDQLDSRSPHHSRTFRIFVSSTFSDLKPERNALQERVFPKLCEFCDSRACGFQAIDLRWGISEEAGLDQQTMSICLEESRRCQRVLPRPNFIILIGDSYGWEPMPPRIEALEFDRLMNHLSESEVARLRFEESKPMVRQGDWQRLESP